MYQCLLITSIWLALSALTVFGQSGSQNPDRQQQAERRKAQRDLESTRGTFNGANKNYENEIKGNEPRKVRRPRSGPAGYELRAERKKLLAARAPNAEDVARYKEFLRQPKTGLFRLFPDLGCEAKNLIRVDGACEGAVLSSSAYSFRQKDYVANELWDLRLKDGNLIADGFLAQEIIVVLGDVALENLSLGSPGIDFLSAFEPLAESKEARRQFREVAKIIDSGGYRYGKIGKALLNTTYAMRIAAYRRDDKKLKQLSAGDAAQLEKAFWYLDSDERIDLVVAFRIVRQDADGNVTILWKELDRRRAPRIVFAKEERMSDIKQ